MEYFKCNKCGLPFRTTEGTPVFYCKESIFSESNKSCGGEFVKITRDEWFASHREYNDKVILKKENEYKKFLEEEEVIKTSKLTKKIENQRLRVELKKKEINNETIMDYIQDVTHDNLPEAISYISRQIYELSAIWELTSVSRGVIPGNIKEILTREETANLLSVTLVTLHNWHVKGILKSHKVGNQVRYFRNEIEGVLNGIKLAK